MDAIAGDCYKSNDMLCDDDNCNNWLGIPCIETTKENTNWEKIISDLRKLSCAKKEYKPKNRNYCFC